MQSHLHELGLVDAADELDVAGKVGEVRQPGVGAGGVQLKGRGEDGHRRQRLDAPPDAAGPQHMVLLLQHVNQDTISL